MKLGTKGHKVTSTHSYLPDPRNDAILVYVNGRLVPRADAMVSVFDSGFVLGDGVWESFRLVRGTIVFLDEHLDRLFAGARAVGIDIGQTKAEIMATLYDLIQANEMSDGAHIRLMVTRGPKSTPSQDPRLTIGEATMVIIPEFKVIAADATSRGIRLATVAIRCSAPDTMDMKLNSHSRLSLIIALRQALAHGADEALMLDPAGFVSTCNATNFFIVRAGDLWTSTGEYCLNGITRRKVIEAATAAGINVFERNFTLAETLNADEAFATGTVPGVRPVAEIDGQPVGSAQPGPVTRRLAQLYRDLVEQAASAANNRPDSAAS